MGIASATISTSLQSRFIDDHGTKLVHAVAIKCPCRNEDVFASMGEDGANAVSVANHALCGNERWLYRDPKPIIGLVTGMNQQLTTVEMGFAQPGDMLFSPQLLDKGTGCQQRAIGQWDRLTATIPQILDGGQVIIRGAGTAGENRGLTASDGLAENEDRLWYEPAGAPVLCIDFNGIEYAAGDYILGPGKKIAWLGKQPADGVRYSLKYMALLEWIAVLPPQERYEQQRSIGQRVMLRKWHVERVNQRLTQTPDAGMAKRI